MLTVSWCTHKAAKHAVETWHYSGRMTAVPLASFGVWEDGRFIGAVVFGAGANANLHKPFGVGRHEACELVRVALIDGHRAPTSQIVALAVRKFRKRFPRFKVIVSYADPWEGHAGGIYQAMNWIYLGKSDKDRFPLYGGRVVHPRTVSDLVKAGKVKRNTLTYVTRPGKHKYALALDSSMNDQLVKVSLPYPKNASEACDGPSPGNSGGETPARTLQS